MRPTQQLTEEHETVKEMLKIMDSEARRLEAGQRVDIKHLEDTVEFLQVFVGACHHAKEEQVLIPAMAEVGMPSNSQLIDSILTDHELAHAWVEGIAEGVADYGDNKASAPPKIIENIRYYLSLLGEHIKKEDFGLFPLADTLIEEKRQEEMLEEFEKIERERIGPGKHEALKSIIEQLKQAYT